MRKRTSILCALLAAAGQLWNSASAATSHSILNVSYDVTREFYQDYNRAFINYWKEKTGETAVIAQSHDGSGKQAFAVLNGLGADVVTMNQTFDIDVLNRKGRLLPQNWAARLPHGSVPYTSTIVFVVRGGNPRNIRNWDDLIQSNLAWWFQTQRRPAMDGTAIWRRGGMR
jgi:sulfate transport system substrate-binding protein